MNLIKQIKQIPPIAFIIVIGVLLLIVGAVSSRPLPSPSPREEMHRGDAMSAGEELAQWFLAKGRGALRAGRFAEALSDANLAIALDPASGGEALLSSLKERRNEISLFASTIGREGANSGNLPVIERMKNLSLRISPVEKP